MNEEAFREKYTPKKTATKLCITCGLLPKALPKHKCYWCQLKHEGTDAEVTACYERKARTDIADGAKTDDPNWKFCATCYSSIPVSYMFNGKRCRGCELIRQRDKNDAMKYGLGTGERQVMFTRQDGKCWGCRSVQRVTGLAVHHSHYTGEAHFMACITCNRLVMGNAQDDPITLLRLAVGMLHNIHAPGGMERAEAIIDAVVRGEWNSDPAQEK